MDRIIHRMLVIILTPDPDTPGCFKRTAEKEFCDKPRVHEGELIELPDARTQKGVLLKVVTVITCFDGTNMAKVGVHATLDELQLLLNGDNGWKLLCDPKGI